MNGVLVILKRELQSYFATPLAYVFIFIFLVLSGVFTFYLGNFFEREQADLTPFFSFHPWLYLFLIPAISMRLWSEERKTGTIELLMTLPVTRLDAVLGKFLAAWSFAGLALVLTFPLWITVNYLGDPDNGVIFASYLGSFLMAGGFLAIGSCMSALTRSQVIAFIGCGIVCLLFVLAGFQMITGLLRDWLPLFLVDTVASLSCLMHFNAVSRGVVGLADFVYFLSMIGIWLAATVVVLEMKQAD